MGKSKLLHVPKSSLKSGDGPKSSCVLGPKGKGLTDVHDPQPVVSNCPLTG